MYFFNTVRVRYYTLAFAHLFFIALPFLAILIKFIGSSEKKCKKRCLDCLVIELLGINNIWDIELGWFPTLKNEKYRMKNYSKRMVFYLLMDLPLLTIKVLNNLYTGNTFTLLQCFSILMQLLGLFSSTFAVKEVGTPGTQDDDPNTLNKNTLQKFWCVFLWLYLITF